jgi:hypothetical protein
VAIEAESSTMPGTAGVDKVIAGTRRIEFRSGGRYHRIAGLKAGRPQLTSNAEMSGEQWMTSEEVLQLALVPELEGTTIENVHVFSDAVLITLAGGKTGVAVFDTADGLRIHVGSRGQESMPVGVRVYPGQFPYPGELPRSARRR